MACFERGLFDISKDDYEDACQKLAFHWHYYETMKLPF
jgi:hypothetical protein